MLTFLKSYIIFLTGEHKTEEFQTMSPFSELPLLIDGEIKVYGPCPILLYLAEKCTKFQDFGEDNKQQMMVCIFVALWI